MTIIDATAIAFAAVAVVIALVMLGVPLVVWWWWARHDAGDVDEPCSDFTPPNPPPGAA